MRLSLKLKIHAMQDGATADQQSLMRIAELVERMEGALEKGVAALRMTFDGVHQHPEIEFAPYLDDMENALKNVTFHPKAKTCTKCRSAVGEWEFTDGILCQDCWEAHCGDSFWQEMANRRILSLEEQNAKLRKLIELGTEIEDEDPGCGECAKRHDETCTDLNEMKFGWHQYKQEKQNEVIQKYNELYKELDL
jgi:hypothetical protein